ncbi:hypothetical protein JQ612_26305 [Bradyrhizobium manausense]|uniref:hypothetical protein n=1 Tax=Bradyrhizobium manausense TaxID=989370 RepID=UPI001BAB70BB|nr:hypothetical protein [Bradyrhizobium manausense]MBR0836718.1 hypothetical protein [Bradyrhizobium manausense]
MLKNPFLVYIAAFGTAIAIYQLGWSDLYPPLTWDLLLFFGFTFLASVLLARLIGPFINQTQHYTPGLLPGYATLFVIATFVGDVMLGGGIPLIFVLRGAKFYAIEANATHLHAFTLWSTFSAIRFADFLYSRRYRYLAEAALPVIFYILLVYRGPALMCLLSWMFVFLIWKGRFKRTHIAFGTAALVLAGYLNGVMGDVRSPGQESVGAPSAAFQASGVPRTYFWTYLYATSPLANFQLAVSTVSPGQGDVLEFIASDLLPDTLSKKILPMLNDKVQTGSGNLATRDDLYSWDLPQIAPGINIATLFGRSYGYFGWIGPVIMFATLSAFIILYAILIRNSPYRVPALALLNVLVVFCLFNNMLASAAMLPQLIWPLLIPPWRHRETLVSDPASEKMRAV